MGLDVEWDEEKAELNERKHGVSFEEALTVLNGILFRRPCPIRIIPNASSGCFSSGVPRSDDLVPIDPDLREIFPDAEAVNQALRAMASVIRARSAA